MVVQDLGDVALHQKRYDRAFALFGRTADIYAKALGADNPSVAFPLTALGEAYLEAGDAQHALATLERADALRQASEPNPRHKAETRFALARALWAAGRGPELARRRAAEARALLIGADGSKEELATVDAWLAAHGGRRR